MAIPYICTPCRCQLAVRRAVTIPRQQRQRISYSHHQASQSVDYERHAPVATRSTRYSRPYKNETDRSPSESPASQGQQSGTLRPTDLLKQLQSHESADPARPRVRHVVPTAYTELQRTLKRDDSATWSAIQDIVTRLNEARDSRSLVRRDSAFSEEIWSWAFRTQQRWLDVLKGCDPMSDGAKEWEMGIPWSANVPPPAPSESASFCTEVAAPLSGPHLARMIWALATEILEMQARNVPDNIAVMETAMRELMALWNRCMRVETQRRSANAEPQLASSLLHSTSLKAQSKDWSFLPSTKTMSESLALKYEYDFKQALALLVPSEVGKHSNGTASISKLHFDYASSALVTFHLLRTSQTWCGTDLGRLNEYYPWNVMVKTILNKSNKHATLPALSAKIKTSEEGETKQAYQTITNRWHRKLIGDEQTTVDLTVNGSTSSAPEDQLRPPDDVHQVESLPHSVLSEHIRATGDEVLDQLVDKSSTHLYRAVARQDIGSAHETYNKIQAFQAQYPMKQIPLALYEEILLTFLTLRDAHTATAAWNQLVAAGHKPTSKTYTVMMRGAQNVRDIFGMQNFWRKMREDGIQPDSHAWSVLIFGLFRAGKHDYGLKALHNLSDEWLKAARMAYARSVGQKEAAGLSPAALIAKYPGDIDGVARPDLVIMNSAIAALAGRNDTLIPKVLAWGRSFGIEKDIITYNVMLNILMRHSLDEDAAKLFQEMSHRGIQANSTTWTVLLTALFERGTMNDLSHAEQEAKVMDLIRSSTTSKAKSRNGPKTSSGLDLKGYALLIDRLLKDCNNPSAAQSVLSHMIDRGIKPNSYICTILMTAYFQQTPPDFTAVDALWNSINSANYGYGMALDGVFYDRMIESYAQHHQALGTAAPLLQFLSEADSKGKPTSWRALLAAARCLAERNEWEHLASLVARARSRLQLSAQLKGGFRPDTMTAWKRDFLEFVIQTGILANDGITTPEQLLALPAGVPLLKKGIQGAVPHVKSEPIARASQLE